MASAGGYLRRVSQFAVSAVGRDRPGIVAAITAGLLGVDGNVEDSRMTNLGGYAGRLVPGNITDLQTG